MNNDALYHLYMLLCDDRILYTGIAINPADRLLQHQQGHPNGAKFTRKFKQLELVYQVMVGTRAKAQSLEIKVKKLNRKNKLRLIKNNMTLNEIEDFLSDI